MGKWKLGPYAALSKIAQDSEMPEYADIQKAALETQRTNSPHASKVSNTLTPPPTPVRRSAKPNHDKGGRG
jgi:hypothetical protein